MFEMIVKKGGPEFVTLDDFSVGDSDHAVLPMSESWQKRKQAEQNANLDGGYTVPQSFYATCVNEFTIHSIEGDDIFVAYDDGSGNGTCLLPMDVQTLAQAVLDA